MEKKVLRKRTKNVFSISVRRKKESNEVVCSKNHLKNKTQKNIYELQQKEQKNVFIKKRKNGNRKI